MFDLSTGIMYRIFSYSIGISSVYLVVHLHSGLLYILWFCGKIKHFQNSVVRFIRIVISYITGNHDFLCVKSFT